MSLRWGREQGNQEIALTDSVRTCKLISKSQQVINLTSSLFLWPQCSSASCDLHDRCHHFSCKTAMANNIAKKKKMTSALGMPYPIIFKVLTLANVCVGCLPSRSSESILQALQMHILYCLYLLNNFIEYKQIKNLTNTTNAFSK